MNICLCEVHICCAFIQHILQLVDAKLLQDNRQLLLQHCADAVFDGVL